MKGIFDWLRTSVLKSKEIKDDQFAINALGAEPSLDYNAMAKEYKKTAASEMAIGDVMFIAMGQPLETNISPEGMTAYKWKPESFEFLLTMVDEISRRVGKHSSFKSTVYKNGTIPSKYFSYYWYHETPIISLSCICSEIGKNKPDRIDVLLIVAPK